MHSFKQFLLLEGGKAMAEHGVERATKEDIKSVLRQLARVTGIGIGELQNSLLGSTTLTLAGKQQDSGDIDIGFHEDVRDKVVRAVKKLTGVDGREIGASTISFPFDTGSKKVQVDLMFVPDMKWAKFAYHAADDGHKSGVRNELLHSTLRFSPEAGKDLRIQDESGRDIARASRSYKLDSGVERIFKVAPMRKDGKGRTKGVVKASPKEVLQAVKELGRNDRFSSDADLIRDPDKFAKLLFGEGTKGSDLLSTTQLISLIKKRKDAEQIFKHAVKAIKTRKFEVPKELEQYA